MSVRFIAYLALLAATIALFGCEAQPPPARPAVVWLDYQGGGIPTPPRDDGCSGRIQPELRLYNEDEVQFEADLRRRFDGLAITFTTAHPPEGSEYLSVVLTGGTADDCRPGATGVGEAPILCPLDRVAGTGYVFTGGGIDGDTASGWADVTAHEVGHMLGLVHVGDDDIMNPQDNTNGFGVAPLLGDEPSCDGSKIQDAPSILLARLGPVGTSVTP
jgi:hypothetical protein